jgi:hypothetical protein
MKYPIEKGIKIPKINAKRLYKYPFRDMELNDSFFISCEETDSKMQELKRRVSSSITSASTRLSRKFILREVDNGVRVWRIK